MQMSDRLIRIFEKNNIPYQLAGRNVKRGNLTIKCPFCGSLDKGMHLGINLDDGAFSCWRDHEHRGRNTARLVSVLLRCSIAQARSELGLGVLDDDEYVRAIKFLVDNPEIDTRSVGGVSFLSFESSFRTIDRQGLRSRFWSYLEDRGFSDSDIEYLCSHYNLHCTLSGDFKNRIIIPVYLDDQLVTWTSRSIDSRSELRYKDLAIEKSIRHCKFCLLDYDYIKEGGEILFVVEGPFDAMNLAVNLPDAHKVTCLFTKQMTEEQSMLLVSILDLYSKVVILFDADAWVQGINLIATHFPTKNGEVVSLPAGVKDPGELSFSQVQSLLKEIE
jgi:hypothetical protein